jgi:hypothetical protein
MYDAKRIGNPGIEHNMRYKDMLIDLLGYVSYDYHGIYSGVVLGLPNPYVNGKTVTTEQFNMIERLIDLNNDSYLQTMSQLSQYGEKHQIDELVVIKSK